MNAALPLGSRFLAHIIGTVALIWRTMLRAAAIAGGTGFVVVEIADCVVAHHFPPSILAQWVALALAFGLAYSTAVTVLLIEVIGSVATTIRHLEGDARAGLGAAETLAALEAGSFFLRHDRAQTQATAATATAASAASRGQAQRSGTTMPPTSARRPIPSQQRTYGTNPLPTATYASTGANGRGRVTTSRPRTIGEAATFARTGVSSGSALRPVSQWPTAAELASTPQLSTPVTPFAEGELVPQLPPLPVRADRLPRIEWANVEDAPQGRATQTRGQAVASAPAVAVDEATPLPADRDLDEHTLPASSPSTPMSVADAAGLALGVGGLAAAAAAAASQPAYTDPPLVAPAWGPQFDESAIGSDTPTIVPTLSQMAREHTGEEPTMHARPGDPAPPTRPRQALPTRPLSRGLPRPSGPFDMPTQGGGLWERLGQALRGQGEQVPATSSDPSSATEAPTIDHTDA